MWHKLLLLSLYILVLFFLSRLLEAAVWYHGDHYFSHSVVLDPFSLSVSKLRQLLDSRGVSYANAIEKQDLTKLVAASGQVTEQELLEAEESDRLPLSHQTVHFSGGSHFYEEVEDTKDSVWLVQVVAHETQAPILDAATWKQVVARVGRFGVRTGVFKCSLDQRLCARKGWSSPLLVLALPRGYQTKEDVVMHNYLYPAKMQSVLHWLHQHLSSRVTKIPSVDDLNSNWLSVKRNPKESPLRVVYISTVAEAEPPLFLSALAIKFTGRVQFGMIKIRKTLLKNALGDGHTNISYMKDNPTYLIVTPEKVIPYGHKIGEIYSFKRMDLFLRTFHPEMNDIFLISLFLVNITIGLEFFLISGKLWRHCIRWILQLVKCNCTLFLFWLVLLGAHQFKIVNSATNFSLQCVRFVGETHLATIIRNDWFYIYSAKLLTVTFVSFGLLVTILRKKFDYGNEEDLALFSDWWSVPWDSYVMNYFFRPMATLTRPLTPQDLDLEEGLEMFIERLAVPNLWLLPVIQMDYLKELPVWKFCGGGCETEDEMTSQDETSSLNYVLNSSEDESARRYSKKTKNCSCFHKLKKLLTISKKKNNEDNKNKRQKENLANLGLKKNGHHHTHKQESSDGVCCSENNIQIASTSKEKCRKELSIPMIPSHSSSEENERKNPTNYAPMGMLDCYDCSICLESYHNGESLCGLPCGHNYHLNCIMLWLTRDNHCCPICRWPSFKPNPKTNQEHLHSQ